MRLQKRKSSSAQFVDMAGRAYGQWRVLSFAGFSKRYAVWKCKCVCGTVALVRGHQLRAGRSTSCGCVNKRLMKLGNTRDYQTWRLLPKKMVCKRWRSFTNFIADMGRQPKGCYLVPKAGANILNKRTCEWAPYKRPPIGSLAYKLSNDGIPRPAKEIAAELGISRQALYQRMKKAAQDE